MPPCLTIEFAHPHKEVRQTEIALFLLVFAGVVFDDLASQRISRILASQRHLPGILLQILFTIRSAAARAFGGSALFTESLCLE
jgi:hypothetical protein